MCKAKYFNIFLIPVFPFLRINPSDSEKNKYLLNYNTQGKINSFLSLLVMILSRKLHSMDSFKSEKD